METLKGLSWMGGLRVSTRAIAFVKIAILARLLTPDQFGVFAIASLVLAFLEILTETGVNVFLIQGEGELRDYVNTSWIVSIIRGALISLVILILAAFISSFFNSPDSYNLLRLISIVPFLRGFINPAIVKFQKELKFNREFIFRLPIFSFDAIVAIILTYLTRSASSLVWGLIAGAVLEILLSFIFIEPKPKLAFDFSKVKKVIGRGKWVTASGVFNYLFHQGDDIVVGRLLNTSSLGLYQVAYKISTLPITEVADVFGTVTFPIYAKISSDSKRLKNAFFRTTLGVSALVIPLGLIIFFFTKEVVLLILGVNWLEAVPVLKVLSVFGIVRAISGSSSSLFFALKKQEYVTMVTFISILGLAASIIPLVRKYGIVGAGVSALIGSILALPVIVFYLIKVFKHENKKS